MLANHDDGRSRFVQIFEKVWNLTNLSILNIWIVCSYFLNPGHVSTIWRSRWVWNNIIKTSTAVFSHLIFKTLPAITVKHFSSLRNSCSSSSFRLWSGMLLLNLMLTKKTPHKKISSPKVASARFFYYSQGPCVHSHDQHLCLDFAHILTSCVPLASSYLCVRGNVICRIWNLSTWKCFHSLASHRALRSSQRPVEGCPEVCEFHKTSFVFYHTSKLFHFLVI